MTHPARGRPLAALGCYGRTSGGCDTIRKSDGGLPAVFQTAEQLSGAGYDILVEGLALSAETKLSRELARRRQFHVLQLATPAELCGIRLARRRRRSAAEAAVFGKEARAQSDRISLACAALDGIARVERLSSEDALVRTGELTGAPALHPVGGEAAHQRRSLSRSTRLISSPWE